MNSSETSAKYSWPRSEQKEEIHDSGVPEEVDIFSNFPGAILFSHSVADNGRLSVGVMVEMEVRKKRRYFCFL